MLEGLSHLILSRLLHLLIRPCKLIIPLQRVSFNIDVLTVSSKQLDSSVKMFFEISSYHAVFFQFHTFILCCSSFLSTQLFFYLKQHNIAFNSKHLNFIPFLCQASEICFKWFLCYAQFIAGIHKPNLFSSFQNSHICWTRLILWVCFSL